jgi:hypothetical protein
MLLAALALAAPAHAMSPVGAAWSSAGAGVGAGALMFFPGTVAYSQAVPLVEPPPDCDELNSCEGYGFGVLMRSTIIGGTVTFGMSAAVAGTVTHSLTVKHGGWNVLLAGGTTSLVATALTCAAIPMSNVVEGNELPATLLVAGVLGNLVAVPVAVGLASGGEARDQQPVPQARPAPALTGIGFAPVEGGASVGMSMRF